jgi:hypothetical protein
MIRKEKKDGTNISFQNENKAVDEIIIGRRLRIFESTVDINSCRYVCK